MMTTPHLDAVLDSLEEGVQVLSHDWRYEYVNAAAARQGRSRPEQLVGRTMLDCYPGIERTPMFATLVRCRDEKRAENLDNEFTYEDGSRAWFELRIRPYANGVVILSLDMTARKTDELRLEDAHREALRDLVTPVIRLHEGILLVPLVGALDDLRAAQMTERVLTQLGEENAKVVIFDVSGVPSLDTSVAHHLLETTAMVRLLGAKTILTGVAAATAKAMVHLGVDLATMRTTTRLEQGIELALADLGRRIVGGANR